ncbi:MAG: methyl-accepting chemotaxis protein [Crenarchaeota archaeon]|nr:methyl-accepting chemotaxis protein [Thermoproteota archaeon]
MSNNQCWKYASILLFLILLSPLPSQFLSNTETVANAAFTGTLQLYTLSNTTASIINVSVSYRIIVSFQAVNLTGVQNIWVWFSTNNSTAINGTDAWYLGPIPVADILASGPVGIRVPCSKTFQYAGIPPNASVTAGQGYLYMTIPVALIANQTYYVKATDLPPSERYSISSADVVASSNALRPLPDVVPVKYVMGEPTGSSWRNTTVNILVGAANTTRYYYVNFTVGAYTPSFYTQIIVNETPTQMTIPGDDYNPPWNWTGYNVTVKLPDINVYPGYIKQPSFTVTDNSTGYSQEYDQYPYSFIYLGPQLDYYGSAPPLTPALVSNPFGSSINDQTNPVYPGQTLIFRTMAWTAYGHLTVTLNNTWVLVDNVSLNAYGSLGAFSWTSFGGYLNITVPPDIPSTGYYNLTFTDGYYTGWTLVYIVRSMSVTLNQTSGYVGDVVGVDLQGFGNYTGYYVTIWYTTETSNSSITPLVDPASSIPLATILLHNGSASIDVVIPPSTKGYHTIWVGDTLGHPLPGVVTGGAIFRVDPDIVVIPSFISNTTSYIDILCTGLSPANTYTLKLDASTVFNGLKPSSDGSINYTVPATGLYGSLHALALYEESATGQSPRLVAERIIGSQPQLLNLSLTGTTNITEQLATIISLVNNTYANTYLIEDLVRQIGENITLKLISINGSLAELIITGIGRIGDLNTSVLKIYTNLESLNASIISILGDTAIIKTVLGDINISIGELNQSYLDLRDLLLTMSGKIVGIVETSAGNITADLGVIEELVNRSLINLTSLNTAIKDLETRINNTFLNTQQLKTLIEQLGANTTKTILSVNSSLAKLLIASDNSDEKLHLMILSNLSKLDAEVQGISESSEQIKSTLNMNAGRITVLLNTVIGRINTTLETLLHGQAKLAQIMLNNKGELLGIITSKAGNITAKLSDIEALVKNGLPVDTGSIAGDLKKILDAVNQLNLTVTQSSANGRGEREEISSTLEAISSSIKELQSIVLKSLASLNQSLSMTLADKISSLDQKINQLNNTISAGLSKVIEQQSSLGAGTNNLSLKLEDYKNHVDQLLGSIKEENMNLYSQALTIQYVTIAMVAVAIISSLLGLRKK